MCPMCDALERVFAEALESGDIEKLNTTRRLRDLHRKNYHTIKTTVVAICDDYIVWPNGVRWEVYR